MVQIHLLSALIGLGIAMGIIIFFLLAMCILSESWEQIKAYFTTKFGKTPPEEVNSNPLEQFLNRHGWQILEEEDRSPALTRCRVTPKPLTLYNYYDMYWRQYYEKEFGHLCQQTTPVQLYRFKPDGTCITFEGNKWEVAILELNQLMSQPSACKPCPTTEEKKKRLLLDNPNLTVQTLITVSILIVMLQWLYLWISSGSA